MKQFFSKFKKIITPLAVANAAAGLITMISYLIFAKSGATRAESAAFLLILFFCLLIVFAMVVYY